jgi:hypothetical protein
MAKGKSPLTVAELILEIDRQLAGFQQEASGLTLRGKVLRLVAVRHAVNGLGVAVAVEHGLSAGPARERMRVYFLENVGTILDGDELAVISGISDYPRRIRELRVEQGYRILTGASPDPDCGVDLTPDQYLLATAQPDTDSARRWAIANRIRRSASGSKDQLLEFLRENVGRVVTTEDLAYVSDDARQFARRVRELRTEEGFPIATRFTGRPDLAMGEYVLLSLDRLFDAHDRHIPLEIQRAVYERDANTCRLCGWEMTKWTAADPRILELHHLKPHRERGDNTPENLIVICSRCHDGVHAGTIMIPFATG